LINKSSWKRGDEMSESKNQTRKKMRDYAVALGIVFGAAIGISFGTLLNYDLSISAAVGAGFGIIIVSIFVTRGKKK
jgi:hypothetical protein